MVAPSLKKQVQGQAFKIVLWQMAGVAALAVVALIVRGVVSAYSVLAGGLAYVLPNLVFVWQVFRFSGAQQMTKFAVAFIVGEMFKLLLSGILFIVIVKTLPVSLLSVLAGFIGAIVSFWIACGVGNK